MQARRTSLSAGSSPRPWGTRLVALGDHLCDRFIPTPVGNAPPFRPSVPPMSVHPHARGERVYMAYMRARQVGSSPRPWGTRRLKHAGPGPSGFIPTPVGNASALAWASCSPTVHPHARGERDRARRAELRQHGSSPRPWGTPGAMTAEQKRVRFIPTPVGNARRVTRAGRRFAVHPHARGERACIWTPMLGLTGSSPRPWGTHVVAVGAQHRGRFIPTPVGNAASARTSSPASTVHPHARGERQFCIVLAALLYGSSPRPWGTLEPMDTDELRERFIPTPVGNAWRGKTTPTPWPVHPHARGERRSAAQLLFPARGSSPRPWGTRCEDAGDDHAVRFIPTPVGNAALLRIEQTALLGSSPRPWGTPCPRQPPSYQPRFIPTPVGNASASPSAPAPRPVHPHARGERALLAAYVQACAGSSPRPWGTPSPPPARHCRWRFIPTPVGNASVLLPWRLAMSVHPHARGERTPSAAGTPRTAGSSPRPWGTPSPPPARHCRWRFIPTPVGNAPRRSWSGKSRAVHPHARGERRMRRLTSKLTGGSSPRPWGTHVAQRFNTRISRFIPTPVGNACFCFPSRGVTTVHPHARGERGSTWRKSSRCCGSSPRPWGTQRRHGRYGRAGRFIPTPVGNASSSTSLASNISVHPHARGERPRLALCRRGFFGSSPRPWGTPSVGTPTWPLPRFIPTPVGNAVRCPLR